MFMKVAHPNVTNQLRLSTYNGGFYSNIEGCGRAERGKFNSEATIHSQESPHKPLSGHGDKGFLADHQNEG